MTSASVRTFVLALLWSVSSAAAESSSNLLAVGQGISSPSSTSTVNFTSGFTSESPIGTIYQSSFRITGQYDQNGVDAFGGELGYGAGQWGIAGGYRKPDCTGCEGRGAGALGISVSDIGFGIRFAEDLYSVAAMLNPQDQHRFGLMAELNESSETNRVSAFGVGYSYVAPQFTFTVDASKRQFENDTGDDRLIVTPGLMLRADILQVSVNDRITLNANNGNTAGGDETVHDFWFGVGIGKDQWHIAVYGDYVNELALAGSLFF